MIFVEKLNAAAAKNRSLVCVGLDTDPALIPAGISVLDFNKAIIDATAELVCAYKPNIAFYEAQGEKGLDALHKTIAHIPRDIPVILDAKRGDIGNTAQAYAKAVFEQMNCDAVTASPYLGFDSMEPFLNYKDKGVIIICRTSNKGGADFQAHQKRMERAADGDERRRRDRAGRGAVATDKRGAGPGDGFQSGGRFSGQTRADSRLAQRTGLRAGGL